MFPLLDGVSEMAACSGMFLYVSRGSGHTLCLVHTHIQEFKSSGNLGFVLRILKPLGKKKKKHSLYLPSPFTSWQEGRGQVLAFGGRFVNADRKNVHTSCLVLLMFFWFCRPGVCYVSTSYPCIHGDGEMWLVPAWKLLPSWK